MQVVLPAKRHSLRRQHNLHFLLVCSCFFEERLLEQFKSKPAPVDAMMRDFSFCNVHNFQNIHLIAIRCLSWIFPHETMPVPKESSITIPAHQFIWASPDSLFKKSSKFCSAKDTALRIIENGHG